MNIQDILRGLPFPMQGALMSIMGNQAQSPEYYTPSASVNQIPTNNPVRPSPSPSLRQPQQVPKDEAGFENMIARFTSQDSGETAPPLPVTEVPTLPPVAAAMAQEPAGPSAESVAPDNRDVGGGQNFAMQGPNPMQAASGQGNGILGYLDNAVGYSQPDFLSRFGTALAVAGSQDPTKALMQLQQNRAEEGKLVEARRKANMPKVDHIPGTPYFQITKPDGTTEMTSNPALAAYYKSQSEGKAAQKETDMRLQARLNAEAVGVKADSKAAEASIPEIKSANSLLESIKTGRETLSRMGTSDQIKGLAGGAGDIIAGFAAPQMNIDSQRREAVRVLDWVNSSAGLKGALSNVEGLKLDMPLPKPTAAKEEWAAYFDNAEKIVNSALTHFQTQAARSPSAASTVGLSATPSPAAPAASGGVARPSSKAQYDALPSGAKYIAPNGMELTKK